MLPCLQDRRVIEYVVLGDYPTAVGFLLASKPERTARYYRDALCTLALAVRPWLSIWFSAMRDHEQDRVAGSMCMLSCLTAGSNLNWQPC